MTVDETLSVRINGEERRVAAGTSVAALIAALELDSKRVAIERNLEIVPRSTFERVQVEDGDQFEIVHIVGGG